MSSVSPLTPSGAIPSSPPSSAPPPKEQSTWEWIVSLFKNLFFPQRHFTQEMKDKITLAKLGPHDLQDVSSEEEKGKFREAILKFIGKTLKNKSQEKEIGRFYELLYKMVGTVATKQGEVERLRREYLPSILTELLLSEEGKSDEMGELFAALCPFFNDGRLQLDRTREEDKPLILEHQSIWDRLNIFSPEPSLSFQELRTYFGDRSTLSSYLVAKFKDLMEKEPEKVDAFLQTMGHPKDPKLTTDQQKSNLEIIAGHLVPKVVDAFLEKVREKGDLSPLFDKGIELLKDHLTSLEKTDQQQVQLRQTIDELRSVLLRSPVLDEDSAHLAFHIWGDEANLLPSGSETFEQVIKRREAFLNSPIARKREDYYLKEARYRAMEIDSENVGVAALQVTDSLNLVRKQIRYEKKRPSQIEENKKAILELRTLLSGPIPYSLNTSQESIARMIWGDKITGRETTVSDEEAYRNRVAYLASDKSHQRERTFLESSTVHFMRQKTASGSQSPAKKGKSPSSSPVKGGSRPPSPTVSHPALTWGWEFKEVPFPPLTKEKREELDQVCLTNWGLDFQALVDLPDIDREYIFRELAYKNYVKDKRATQIAALASDEIKEMLSPIFIDKLIDTLKASGELGPFESLLQDENFVQSIKTLLPLLVTNGAKWAMKNVVFEMFLEAAPLKRVVDDILPASIETIHTVLMKTLLQQHLSLLAEALIDPDKQSRLFDEIACQYKAVVQKELLEAPPFNAHTVIKNIFEKIQADLSPLLEELKKGDPLTEKEKRSTVQEAIKFYFQPLPGEKNPVYTDLIAVAAFDLGQLPAPIHSTWDTWAVQRAVDRLNLTAIITSSLYPYRKGSREIIRLMTKKFDEMATQEPALTVPFEIRLPYKKRPLLPERIQERRALLTAFATHPNMGSNPTILSINPDHPELVIRFEANKKWLEENDVKTVEEFLNLIGLAPFLDQSESNPDRLLPDSFQLPLREKMINDKMQKLLRPILSIAKLQMGILMPTTFVGRMSVALNDYLIAPYFTDYFITPFINESTFLKLIQTVMKRSLFRGVLYPQDSLVPITSTAKSLSSRTIRQIRSGGLPETATLTFTKDEGATVLPTGEPNTLKDPYPNLDSPDVKNFASLISSGLRAILAPLFNGKDWPFRSALLFTDQTSLNETEAIVKRLLQTVDLKQPIQGSFETSSSFKHRYDTFLERVLATFNGLRAYIDSDDELLQLVEGLSLSDGEKQLMKEVVEALLIDKTTIKPLFQLPLAQRKTFYSALQNHVVRRLLDSDTVRATEEIIGRTLAKNLVLRSGAETEIRVAPLQGADWTEKLLYPLLDVLEQEKEFLQARAKMRQLGEKRGFPHAKAYQLAALIASEKRLDHDEILFDPITAYLRKHQERLEPLLRPLLLSVAPKELQKKAGLDALIPIVPDEENSDFLIKVTTSKRLMGLLMGEIRRAESPFYRFLDDLEERADFKAIRGQKNKKAFESYFDTHLDDPSFSRLLRPVLISFQKPDMELEDLDLTTKQLYQKYKEHIFAPLPLFKSSFKGLIRDEGNFSTLLKPILIKFHPYSIGNLTTSALYEQHLSQLTEGAFRDKILRDAEFGPLVKELIFHFLTPKEKQEAADLSPLQLFEKYKGKLFEPNLYVSLMGGDALRSAPPLVEKLAEILLPTLIGNFFEKLQELERKEAVVNGTKKQRRVIKPMADRAAEKALLHFKGVKCDEADKVSEQLVKQLFTTFLTSPVKDQLVRLLWERKDEIIPLIGLDAQLLEGILENEQSFVDFALPLFESLLVPGRLLTADLISKMVVNQSKPENFQRIILNAIPAITNSLKPTLLTTLFLKEAKESDEKAEKLWLYAQSGTGDIGSLIAEVARKIEGVKFTPEQLLEVQKSLVDKYSVESASTLEAFKAQLNKEEVKRVNLVEHLINKGFNGGMLTKDRLKVGIHFEADKLAFFEFVEEEREILNGKGILIDDEEFEKAKATLLKALESDAPSGLSSKEAKDYLLKYLGIKKSEAYGPLIHQLTSKIIQKVFPSFLQGSVSAALYFGTAESINEAVVEGLKPIIEGADPIATLSTLLQPALSDVLSRDTFTKKGESIPPTLADFNLSFLELGRILEINLLPESFKKVIERVGGQPAWQLIGETLGKTFFDLTKQGSENEDLILHVITSISEQLEAAES